MAADEFRAACRDYAQQIGRFSAFIDTLNEPKYRPKAPRTPRDFLKALDEELRFFLEE